MIYWSVVLTILKNISQWEGLSHILWKIKAMFGTTKQSLYPLKVYIYILIIAHMSEN